MWERQKEKDGWRETAITCLYYNCVGILTEHYTIIACLNCIYSTIIGVLLKWVILCI